MLIEPGFHTTQTPAPFIWCCSTTKDVPSTFSTSVSKSGSSWRRRVYLSRERFVSTPKGRRSSDRGFFVWIRRRRMYGRGMSRRWALFKNGVGWGLYWSCSGRVRHRLWAASGGRWRVRTPLWPARGGRRAVTSLAIYRCCSALILESRGRGKTGRRGA